MSHTHTIHNVLRHAHSVLMLVAASVLLLPTAAADVHSHSPASFLADAHRGFTLPMPTNDPLRGHELQQPTKPYAFRTFDLQSGFVYTMPIYTTDLDGGLILDRPLIKLDGSFTHTYPTPMRFPDMLDLGSADTAFTERPLQLNVPALDEDFQQLFEGNRVFTPFELRSELSMEPFKQ